jgi:hypothetical protein
MTGAQQRQRLIKARQGFGESFFFHCAGLAGASHFTAAVR